MAHPGKMKLRFDAILLIIVIIAVSAVSYNKYVYQKHPLRVRAVESARSWMLQPDGHVRNCITGNAIGRIRQNFTTNAITVPVSTRETAEMRQQSFQNVFDKRVWGTWSDPNIKGPISSGKP